MNFRMICKSLGLVICIEALCMIPSLLISLIHGGGDRNAFIFSILITAASGLALYQIRIKKSAFFSRDGFALVSLSWIFVSLFGALPFLISQAIPSPIHAFFESVSGFTTTGASILTRIEGLPEGILFWRSFTHWMGGMGVLVLTLAILPSVGASSFHIMKAESTGPSPEKLVPKLGQTAKILYSIYIALTALEVIFLLIAGMPLYDALIHAFGTAGTGGFSVKNASVGAYGSVPIEVIITLFMLFFGINFSLYFQILKGNIKHCFRDGEFRFYLLTALCSMVLIALNLFTSGFYSIGESLRHSSFQVSSIMTTTGYATANFNLWPVFSKCILLILMFIGASAGSTGGGIKCIRILFLFKIIRREISRIIHPRAMHPVRINGKSADEETLSKTLGFFFIYIAVFVLSTLIISLDGKDLVSSVSSVIATLSNIGPGLEIVGPTGSYASFSALSKIVFSFCMIAGRLELLPMIILFSPNAWRR